MRGRHTLELETSDIVCLRETKLEMWFWGEMVWLDCSFYFYCLFFHKYKWVAFWVLS